MYSGLWQSLQSLQQVIYQVTMGKKQKAPIIAHHGKFVMSLTGDCHDIELLSTHEHFSLRVWANKTGTGCLGTGWNHHRWRCSRTVEKWHWETWLEHMVGMGRNWMSLVVSSSLNDAMKNVFQSTRLQFQLENIFDSIVSHYHKHGNWMHKMNCM